MIFAACLADGFITQWARIHRRCRALEPFQEQGDVAHWAYLCSFHCRSSADIIRFVGHIIKQTHAHGLTPQEINIEITESAMMCEEDRLITPLSYLYELGFGIHIDDFGTGYSSLARLKALPLSGIKIDRSFIQDITHCKESLQLVQAICAIADTFNLKVTAEGIESKEQIHILQTLHCQQLQGFYLAKPLEALDAQLLLKQTLQVAV